jgi:glycosyltransferase involved in cell wall biosynthesis
MEIGSHTSTVAPHRPAPTRRCEVAIFTGPCLSRWSPLDILTKGLGHSETAAVRIGEQLAKLGYLPTIYGAVESGCLADVLYKPWQAFDPAERWRAVIASRMPQVYDRPVNAPVRLLWAHDPDFGPWLTPRLAERIDRVIGLSRWHIGHLGSRYPFLKQARPRSKLVRLRNGIDRPFFARPAQKRKRRVLCTSSPDRGLDILLELWPQIREQVRDARLAFYPPVHRQAAQRDPPPAKQAKPIERLADQPGVEALGALSEPALARLMLSSLVWCTPSWNTAHGLPFHEVAGIEAMEAQAAGLHVVASDWGALRETVRVGALVDGQAPGESWRSAIVKEIVRGLTDKPTQAHAQGEGPRAMRGMDWEGVGLRFAALIEGEALAEELEHRALPVESVPVR